MADVAALTALIEPEAQALGFDLVRVKFFGGEGDRTLQIMAERRETRQLRIEDCAALSRRISDVMDALEEAGRDPIPHAYRLEVSSPGIDRPLTRLQDFADWAGHEARVTLAEPIDKRKQLNGVITAVEGDVIVIEVNKAGEMRAPFSNIASAKLVITDRLIAATAPLSSDDADEFLIDDAPEGADSIQAEGQD